MLGLYLHIPFCSAICNYCNFNRGLFDPRQKARYVEALTDEICRAAPPVVEGNGTADLMPPYAAGTKVDSIYFGGGTPSLLTETDVRAVLAACRATFDVVADCEITLEANPETVSVETLGGYRRAGVNRISFGVQSFRDEELGRLSRLHGADRAKAAYREARVAGFGNVSLDLMMWLPAQRVGDWLESVEEAIALAPDHLSLYMLEVYPNAPLRDTMARAAWSQAPDDDVADMYVRGLDRLTVAGYAQYEISNVARPGHRSRHNLKYWTDGEWIGFGCGAHSTAGGVRWKNLAGIEDYIARVKTRASPAVEGRRLSDEERLGDALFTGLRLSDGLDVGAINARYGVDVWARYGAHLQSFVDAGLLDVTDSRWRLTRQGMLLAHEVMSIFV